MSDRVKQLEEEIVALQASLATPGLPAGTLRTLQSLLTEKEALLQALRGSAERRGSQINFGSSNTYGDLTFGDIAGGNISKNTYNIGGPVITGPVHAGRDVNIATNQTINNTGQSGDPLTAPPPTTQAAPTPSPALRLELTDTAGEPIEALTVNDEARLRLLVDGDYSGPPLDLALDAQAEAVEWPDDTRRSLKLRLGEPPKPARWSLLPLAPGRVALRVLVSSSNQLLQQLQLDVSCRPAGAEVLSGAAVPIAPPTHYTPVGMALSSAATTAGRSDTLSLVITEETRGYRVLLPDTGLAVTLSTTPQSLADLNAFARAELLAIVNTVERGNKIYTREITIPTPLAETTLARLARLGAALWQGLFLGPGASSDSLNLSEQLRRRSQSGPLQITVAGDVGGFPWHLLYDRELADPQQPITPDGFWGLRHVVALLPTRGRLGAPLGDTQLVVGAHLQALVGMNLTLDQPSVVAQRETLRALGVATTDLPDEPALRAAFATGFDAHLLYLYCHVNNALPGSQPLGAKGALPVGVEETRLVLTTAAQALTLRDLQLAAPLDGRARLSAGPLVVVNACGSAALSPLSYGGLAPYLLDQGARAVIGTECDTPVRFGAAFGSELLRAFAGGASAGAALRDTRRHFMATHQNALGLLYTLYGTPDLRIVRGG